MLKVLQIQEDSELEEKNLKNSEIEKLFKQVENAKTEIEDSIKESELIAQEADQILEEQAKKPRTIGNLMLLI